MPSGLPFRPSDAQRRLDLEQGWEFLADPSAKLTLNDLGQVKDWRSARVGLSWNAQFEDLREYMGAAWYRILFEAPLSRHVRHVLLKFGAVDYFCEVFLNGITVGTHEGGYTPFSFDLSKQIQNGENELTLRVIDPPVDEKQNLELFPEMLYNEIPHGKQSWYVQNSGIWQGVRLEFAPAIYVDRTDVTPQLDGQFKIDIKLAGGGLTDLPEFVEDTRVMAMVYDNAGRLVWEASCPLIHADSVTLHGNIQQPRLWGPSSPALYTLDVALEGAIRYRRRTRFGFRELTAHNAELFLNGKPFYMIAALDQDFYPETIHTPASEEFVRDMMLKAKRLGINTLRCHLKVAHPVYLDVADELGMLVWAELPSWSDSWFPADHFSYKAAQRGEQMFAENMLRDWNHPCLVMQTVMNESWGINLQDAVQRSWLKQTFDRIKKVLAPLGRLVIDNSACEGNFHLKSDIEDFHNYYSQPDQVTLWDAFIHEFAGRAEWTYSPFGDAERTGQEPLVVSEFGNWGLPKLPAELPWWFDHSFGGREVTRPSGVFERFRKFKLNRVFADYNDFAEETQWHQFYSLKYEIESMRRQSTIQGYCVTGMTDVHWEVNGLLDMWRNDKVFAEELQRLQQPDLILGHLPTYNYYSNQTVDVPLLLSHYSERDLAGARVNWSLDSGRGGHLPIPKSIQQGRVETLGTLRLTLPDVQTASAATLQLEVRAKNGTRICENHYTLFVFPAAKTVDGMPIEFYDPLGTAVGLDTALRTAGYSVLDWNDSQHPDGSILISSVIDEKVTRHLNSGHRALILADSEKAFTSECPFKCTKRAATWLDGRWFSNYNWIVPTAEPYRELSFNRLLAFESREVVPQHVIEGVPSQYFDDVFSGITLGWIQLNNALTLQANFGPGRALITTFQFDRYGTDPYSAHLLSAYLRYAARSSWSSTLRWAAAELAPC